jgi:hypothetical protein
MTTPEQIAAHNARVYLLSARSNVESALKSLACVDDLRDARAILRAVADDLRDQCDRLCEEDEEC